MQTGSFAEIFVEGLEFECVIGDLPYEREVPQRVRMDLSIWVDSDRVAHSDSLQDSVNYVALAEMAQKTAVLGRFRLVERLASEILKNTKAKWPEIVRAVVVVRKFSLSNAACSGVRCGFSRLEEPF
ncbi:MAG TPA: dihydroneopterin aldolase [Fibrobacteraceae bacterium]|nr:dihydroneopterin aldolase [Fibrobacteraceae bacterium]